MQDCHPYLVETLLGVPLLELELDERVVGVELRVGLLNLVKLRLRELKLAFGLLGTPLPLLGALPCLEQ